ncbi:methionyl-tRNA formyltransferase [Polynucleobacter sp. IMCC30063]|uniref:methionyl-tRNA formyltransferase n=1 Tax=unclassified Polynucleobacter TaxID=2640945 RepID=UPI001F02803C|nr:MULTISPECIES: methionyl-tRNA formyltransferase [unclassified Polynucleobacter]MCE7504872.1 methionyl-tRNA formyltransferase [Polynucleobacter sp. IMCC30063]MCE7526338.1 methionyl-tRNA formyltransferase [Polynucleobacter sp. IMCC 30228]MCE7528643.1 methionyl-tRNA formyltransferase [Polynucleobacter sp. IMCC 29146]
MKVIFAGTPEFAAQSLRAILAAGHQVVLVLTQPDRPAGRGMLMQASPVKVLALEHDIPVLQPPSLKIKPGELENNSLVQAAFDAITQTDFDLMVVVAYGLLIPPAILDLTEANGRWGCFNVHASLLPRWRGAAPIQRAIQAGDRQTGITIMRMDAGLDTGDQVALQKTPIAADETSTSLTDRLAIMGAQLITQCLTTLQMGQSLRRMPQANEGVSYAQKILKGEAVVNWSKSANEINRQIRAFNPFPGASTRLNGEVLKIWHSQIASYTMPKEVTAGTALVGAIFCGPNGEVLVRCGEGMIELLEVQKPGRNKISARIWFLALEQHPQQQFHNESC